MSQDPKDSGIKTYVLRAGRMTEGQKKALSDLSPRHCIPFSAEILDPARIFTENKPLVLEIGFGMGQATWRIAAERPEWNYLGVEVHAPGVGRLLMEIESRGIGNLKVIQHDAVEVLSSMIRDSSLAGFHIFYPDPWPKKRHHKRRLMRPALVELMARKLAQAGYIYFVTDIEEYAQAAKEVLDGQSSLKNEFPGFAERLPWRPETKFEAKAENRAAFELFYRKC